MNKLGGFLIAICLIFACCGTEEIKDCEIKNFQDISFLNMNVPQRFESAIESHAELIILSEFPEIKLSAFQIPSLFPSWTNTYGLNAVVGANYFTRNKEDNFIIAGIKRQTLSGTLNSWILECNENDTNINELEDETETANIPKAILELENGDYIFTGRLQESNLQFDGDIFIKRVDADGATVWAKILNEGISDEGVEILKTNNGNFFICYTWSGNLLNKGIGIIEIEPTGNILRNKKFESHKESLTDEVIFKNTSNLGIIVSANKIPDISLNSYDPLLLMINGELEIEWSLQNKTENSSQLIYDVKELRNGDFLITGASSGECFEGVNLYVSRISNNGLLLWQHTYGNELTNNSGKYIIEREDGELVIVADQYEKGEQIVSQIIVAEIDQDGNPI